MELLKKVKETISKYSLLSEGDCVLIGLSGGPDSVCLAVILDKLKADFNLSLHAAYIDHGLRPDEVEGEKAFCRDFCGSLGIDFASIAVDVKGYVRDRGSNTQEAARELRYLALENQASKMHAARIALGHNADDRAETFLINLFRGSGRRGLSGIPPARSLEFEKGEATSLLRRSGSGVINTILIIRPLIEIERSEIEEFLSKGLETPDHKLQIPFVTDSSNRKRDYFRNWIRLELFPGMKERSPAIVRTMCRSMDILKEEDDYLEIIVTKTLMRLISRKSNDTIELFLSPLETIEKPILRRVLRRAVDKTEGLRGMDFNHIEAVIGLIKKGKSGDRIHLPKGLRVIREYAVLKITSVPPVRIGEYEISPSSEVVIKESGEVIRAALEGEMGGPGDGASTALFDAGLLTFPLKIRPRSAGDFFYPAASGMRKKLQDYFVDEKIPRDERDRVPIVVSGKDIIWVAGYRADERFRVTGKTERVLRLIISKIK